MDAKTEARCPKPGCGALKAAPCRDWDCPQQLMPYAEHATIVADLKRALAAPEGKAEPVAVKPLIFAKQNTEGVHWTSEVTPVGEYHVYYDGTGWLVRLRSLIVAREETHGAAFGAAQADFGHRVLSCLASPPRADLEAEIKRREDTARREGFQAGEKSMRERAAKAAGEYREPVEDEDWWEGYMAGRKDAASDVRTTPSDDGGE